MRLSKGSRILAIGSLLLASPLALQGCAHGHANQKAGTSGQAASSQSTQMKQQYGQAGIYGGEPVASAKSGNCSCSCLQSADQACDCTCRTQPAKPGEQAAQGGIVGGQDQSDQGY